MRATFLILLATALAPSAFAAGRPLTCAITVRVAKRTGPETLSFRTPLRNAQECRTLARMHEKSFPGEVYSKTVSYSWLGPKAKEAKRLARRRDRRGADRSLVRR